jgi:ABC-type branched-subunit amino acid transport system substrate-binding protein
MDRRSLLRAWPLMAGLTPLGALAAPAPAGVVRFGQSASLSGGQSRYGRDVRDGIAAALQSANRQEAEKGAKALQFELVTLDDGGVKDRGIANVKQLIDGGATALLGLTSGAIAEAALPTVEAARIAMVGTASGNMGIRQPSQAAVSHVRAGYDAEYRRTVQYMRDFGLKRIGCVRLQDTSSANLQAMHMALAEANVKPAVDVAIDRNSKDFSPAVRQLLAAKVDAVLFATNAAPILHMVEQLGNGGFAGMYFASSFAGQDLVDGIALAGRSVIMSMVVPRPTALGLPVVSQCRQDLAALGTGTKLGITSLEGYIAGRVAVEAARAAARSDRPGRETFRTALSSLQADLGGYRVHFGAQQGLQGSQYVDMVVINRHGHIVG